MSEWIPLPAGEIHSPVFAGIARRTELTRGEVISVYLSMLDCAMCADTPGVWGTVEHFCPEDADAMLGLEDGASARVLRAMKDRGLISESGVLTRWDYYIALCTDK